LRLVAPESAYPARSPRTPARPAANDPEPARIPVPPPPPPPSPPLAAAPKFNLRQLAAAGAVLVLAVLAALWFSGAGADAAPALEIEVGHEAGGAPNPLLLLAAPQA